MRKSVLIAVFMVLAAVACSSAQEITDSDTWNPLKADKDIEIGNYYLKRGNYDAAIDRFEEAARLHPGLAMPFLKLGQTHEKKKDWQKALDAYRKYLEIYRTAPDGKDVRKRIRTLEQRIAGETADSSKPSG